MDLELTQEQEAFRAEAREWLAVNVPATPLGSMDTAEGFEEHREWERRLHDGGWGVVSWPTRFGGRGAGLHEWLLFEEEYYAAGAPPRVNQNGLFLLAPTLMEHGTEAQCDRFLPPMARGDDIWCQGWSEPEAGSDLAAIRSRAERRGDTFVLDGQKIWCSRGMYADWLFGLFRTSTGEKKHHGLSMLLVPMDAPGVTVRPIRHLDGHAGFAEVFLDGVEVSAEHLLGEEGGGWAVAMSTAGFERGVSLRSPGRFLAAADRLVDLHRRRGAPEDAADAVTSAWMEAQAYRLFTLRTVSRHLAGEQIGPESSLNKLLWSEMDIRLHETALDLLGSTADLTADAPDAVEHGRWLDGYLFSLSGPIYAGTNEIQRNIVAERMLGLPRS